MDLSKRYDRNMNALSPEECALLREKRVCVVGCGGLGGYIIEILARIGVGHLTVVDGDVFDVTNLNRQLLSSENVIGKSKAKRAKKRVAKVNSEVSVTAVCDFLTAENCIEIVSGHDVVVDALDNASARRILAAGCAEAGITVVHGAIGGWYGQVSVVPPGSAVFDVLYPEGKKDAPNPSGNPSFTPPVIASLEAAEAVKYLCGRESPLTGNLLVIDLKSMDFEIIDIA